MSVVIFYPACPKCIPGREPCSEHRVQITSWWDENGRHDKARRIPIVPERKGLRL